MAEESAEDGLFEKVSDSQTAFQKARAFCRRCRSGRTAS
jgi:hypothetical protein